MKIFEASETNDSFSFELTQSKSKIIEKLEERIKNYKFNWRQLFDSARNYTNYSRFTIEKERIVIKSIIKGRPDPIYIYLEEIPGGKTTLRLEQKNSVSYSRTILIIFSVIMFVIALIINLRTDLPIGLVVLIIFIPLIVWVLILIFIFYILEKAGKYSLRRFAKQIVRSLDQD